MRDPLDQFWADAKDLQLSPEEKLQNRVLLQSGMHLMEHGETLTLTRKERADGFERLASALTDKPILRETFFDKLVDVLNSSFVRVPVTAVLVFMVGGGALAAAAENALPGDALYTFKISITEPLLGTFRHTNTKDNAEWNMVLLERRLDEVEAIATTPNAQKRADPAAKALREQTSEFLNAVDTMLPGDENEELRRAAVRQFDARANFVTNRAMNDPTTHQIIRAMLDEQRRIEKASRSSSSSSLPAVAPKRSSSFSMQSSSSSSSSSASSVNLEETVRGATSSLPAGIPGR